MRRFRYVSSTELLTSEVDGGAVKSFLSIATMFRQDHPDLTWYMDCDTVISEV